MEYIFHSCIVRVGNYIKDFTDYKLTNRILVKKRYKNNKTTLKVIYNYSLQKQVDCLMMAMVT